MDENLKLIFTAELNEKKTAENINAAIRRIQKDIVTLKLNIDTTELTNAGVLLQQREKQEEAINKTIEARARMLIRESEIVKRRMKEKVDTGKYSNVSITENSEGVIKKAVATYKDELGKAVKESFAWVSSEDGKSKVFKSVEKKIDNNVAVAEKKINDMLSMLESKKNELISKQTIKDPKELDNLIRKYDLLTKAISKYKDNTKTMNEGDLEKSQKMIAALERGRALAIASSKDNETREKALRKQIEETTAAKNKLTSGKAGVYKNDEVTALSKMYDNAIAKMRTYSQDITKYNAAEINEVNAITSAIERKLQAAKSAQSEMSRLNRLGYKEVGKAPSGMDYMSNSSVKDYVSRSFNMGGKMPKLENISINSRQIDETGRAVVKLTADIETGKNTFTRYKLALDEASGSMRIFGENIRQTANRNLDFGEKFKNALSSITLWASGTALFYQGLAQLREGIGFVNELNRSLTELSMVYMKSQSEVSKYAQTFHDLGMQMSIATEEVAKGAVEFARQGLNEIDMMERMQQAVIFSKVGALEFNKSAQVLTATVNSMGVTAEHAVDIFSYMGDATATGADEIGIAFQKVGGSAGAINLEFEKVASWIATVSSRTRESAETIGNSIKAIIARVQSLKERGYDEEDGTKLNQVTKALHEVGVQAVDSQGNFRNFGVVMDELGAKWDGLSVRQKAYVATTVAGSHQQARFLNIMEGYGESVKLYEESLTKSGIAQEKFNLYQEGTEAKLTRLHNAITGIYQTLFDTGAINSFVDGFTKIFTVVDRVISQFGLVGPLLGTIATAFVIFKNQSTTAFTSGLLQSLGSFISNMKTAAVEARATAISASTSATAFTGLGAALKALTVTMVGTRVAAIALQATLTMGLSLAITGLISFITGLIDKSSKARDEMNQLSATFKQTIKDTDEKIDGIKKLSNEYGELSNKSNKTKEDLERMRAIEVEMVNVYGVSASGINAQGQAYANNSIHFDKRIEQLEKMKRLEEDNLKNKVKGSEYGNNWESAVNFSRNEELDLKKAKDFAERVENIKKAIAEKAQNPNSPVQIKKFYGGELTGDLSEMQAELKDWEDRLATVNGRLAEKQQEIREATSGLFTALSNDIKNNGAELQDTTRVVLTEFAEALSLSNINIDDQFNIINEMTKQAGQADGLDPLIKKFNELKDTLKADPANKKAADEFKQIAEKIKKAISGISFDTKGNKFLDEALQNTKQELSTLFNAVIKPNEETVYNFKDAFNELKTSFENTTKEVAPLNHAIQTLKEGKKLTTEEINNLIFSTEGFIDCVRNENGILEVNLTAVEKLRDTKVQASKDAISAKQAELDAQKEVLLQSLKGYGIEIKAIGELAKARNALAKKFEETKNNQANQIEQLKKMGAPESVIMDMQAQNNATNDVFTNSLSDIDAILSADKMMDTLKGAANGLSSAGIDPNKTDKKKKEKKGDQTKADPIDEDKQKLERLKNTVTASEKQLERMSKTSQKYRDELNKEVYTYSVIQKVANEAADKYRKKEANLQAEIKKLGDPTKLKGESAKKYNDLSGKLKSVQSDIVSMKDTWWNAQEQMEKKTFEKVKSKLDEFAKKNKEVDDVLATSKARMGTMKEDSVAYRKELELQIVEYEKKKKLAHEEAETIRKNLKNTKLTLEYKEELQDRLEELKKSWWDYQGAIVSTSEAIKKQKEDLANKAIEQLKEQYNHQKKIILDALDEENEAFEENHKNRMDNLDDEFKKQEKLIQQKIKALDKEKNDRKYNQDLNRKQDERQDILNKINILSMDNSMEAKAKIKDLQKTLADLNLDIENMQYDRNKENEKDNLQNELDQLKEKLEKDKEAADYTVKVWDEAQQKIVEVQGKTYKEAKKLLDQSKKDVNKHFEQLLNDERKFAEIKKQIMQGNMTSIMEEFGKLEGFMAENTRNIGDKIDENITDRLEEVKRKLKELQEYEISSQKPSKDANSGNGYGGNYGLYIPANKTENDIIAEMKRNSQDWHSASADKKDQLAKRNQELGKSIGAEYNSVKGIWYKKGSGLHLFHKGGIIGGGSTDSFTQTVNKMFNAKPNEQVVMALKNELMAPQDNILNNFMPNMQNLIASLTPNLTLSPSVSKGENTYNIYIDKVTGDKQGAKLAAGEIIKEIRKRGGRV